MHYPPVCRAFCDYVEGDQANWLELKTCPYDEAQCGDLLRRIHGLEFDGPFCFLGDEHPVSQLGPAVESWADMFPCEHAARRCVELGWIDKRQSQVLAGLADRLESQLQQSPKRLLHMDFMYNGTSAWKRSARDMEQTTTRWTI